MLVGLFLLTAVDDSGNFDWLSHRPIDQPVFVEIGYRLPVEHPLVTMRPDVSDKPSNKVHRKRKPGKRRSLIALVVPLPPLPAIPPTEPTMAIPMTSVMTSSSSSQNPGAMPPPMRSPLGESSINAGSKEQPTLSESNTDTPKTV